MKIPLSRLAHTRSGDKGDTANIGVIAWREAHRYLSAVGAQIGLALT